jgi:radical SAM protein with 4Fe4S-binding SPASM domain
MPFGLPLGLRFGRCTLSSRKQGEAVDLSWVPAFWKSVKPYVFRRKEDGVVILPPTMVYRTNETGMKVLDLLDRGISPESLPGMDASKLRDIAAFLEELRALFEGRAVATALMPYDFDYHRLPILGEIAVTYRCNNRCLFCYAGCGPEVSEGSGPAGCAAGAAGFCGSPADAAGKEMSTREIERVLDIFRQEAKIPFFSFTGGEPLIREDLERLIAYAVKIGLRVNLVTNGTLATPERARALKKAGLGSAQVSIESPDPELHDHLCAAEGAHVRSIAGIEAMKAAGISVQTNSTLTRLNRESLLLMPEFLAGLGISRFSMNLYIPGTAGSRAAELFVPYSETGAFVDEILRRAQAKGLVFHWYSPIPLCLYNPMTRGLGNKNCAAADGLLHVDPAGDVRPCSSWPGSLGNLLVRNFRDIWGSPEASKLKHKGYAPKACTRCNYFVACQAACPLYWNHAGYGELSGARAWRRGKE